MVSYMAAERPALSPPRETGTQPGQWHARVPRLCQRQSQGPRFPFPPLTFPKALSGHTRGLLLATAGSVADRGVQRPPGLAQERCPLPSQQVQVSPPLPAGTGVPSPPSGHRWFPNPPSLPCETLNWESEGRPGETRRK